MTSKMKIEYGNKVWRNAEGKLHRTDGPACEWAAIGTKSWWVDGERHRLDGPAIEWADGSKQWWVDGERHRTDGPAIEWADGEKAWWVDGQDLWFSVDDLEIDPRSEAIKGMFFAFGKDFVCMADLISRAREFFQESLEEIKTIERDQRAHEAYLSSPRMTDRI